MTTEDPSSMKAGLANNPYARFLDGRPVQAILAETAPALVSLAQAISPERINDAPAPGKWSAAQILAHLADCEIAFAFRLRQTLAEDNHIMQPFDQDKWAATYPAIASRVNLPEQSLLTFTALRTWNLLLIQAALPASAGKQASHPERGPMTFSTIVETMAGHDTNHLAQLKAIAKNRV